jgi:hypothetical protein
VMHCLLPTSWVVEEPVEGHASRCRPRNRYFGDSKLQHLVQPEVVVVEPLRLSLSSLPRQQLPLCSVPDNF